LFSDETRLCLLSSCTTIWFIGAMIWFSNDFFVSTHILVGCVHLCAGILYLIKTLICKNKITREKNKNREMEKIKQD